MKRGPSIKNVLVAVDVKEEKEKPKFNNDIKEIRTLKHLDKINLDFDSPRLK